MFFISFGKNPSLFEVKNAIRPPDSLGWHGRGEEASALVVERVAEEK